MIIWIASYPRSGNTLTSQLFKQVFNKVCYEKYNNFYNYINHVSDDKTFDKIGLGIYSGSWPEFYNRALSSEELFLIKTHDSPEDKSPCIYIVRNGLHSTESFYSYQRQVIKEPCQWEDFLMGSVFPFHSWGSHLDSWNPLIRDNTLLIKYEDIISNTELVIQKISNFTKLDIQEKWTNNFSELQKKNPEFFRKGGLNRGLLIPDEIRSAFEELNADWINILGYNEKIIPELKSLKKLRNQIFIQSIKIHERDKYISTLTHSPSHKKTLSEKIKMYYIMIYKWIITKIISLSRVFKNLLIAAYPYK